MSNLRLKLHVLCFVLMMSVMAASAQSAIRYVDCAKSDNTGDGTSWGTAKKDIQEAINDLVNNNLTGEVWVKGSNDAEHPAVYYPTETTESSGSEYYKAFKIPAGITVRGGFKGDEENASERVTIDDKNFGAGVAKNGEASGNLDGEEAKSGVYEYKTILCGDLRPSKVASLVWNKSKQQFNTTFYGNSYHVVWFAMNGFNSEGRANPLTKPAKLEGCVVKGGHAYTSDAIKTHPHEGYGGGIYMVANSFVYNCEVKDCDAARNGGGIYMDGGGIVRRTLVHNCQALGLGTDYGYGGGICEDGSAINSKSNPIVVAQSVVTNCVGRMGGGMALLADETAKANKDSKYAIVANSTLVNNNTAQIEAGGVYTYGGGGLASMTIVRNKCNGSGITQNGQITGRSGGVYSRDASYIGNTVIWGNKCEANKDIQYADSRSSLSDTEKTKFYYSALSNADIADWSKSEKMGVLSLDNNNKEDDVSKKGSKGYPLFENPTDTAGYSYKYFERSYAESFDWKVYSESALHHAGINTADLDYDGLTPAPQGDSFDMQFGMFNSRCTMGAIVSEEPQIDSNNDISGEAHFFVDPNYNFATHHAQTVKGMSWDLPTRFLGNVLEYIDADRKPEGKHEYANRAIFIHVKEGTVDNTDSYKSGRVRTTSLDIPSNVTILGSYNPQLTGTDLSLRNVVHTPTVISAQLMNNYDFNIAHLININNKSDILIEGFKLSYANANSTELGNTNKDGAAITVVNSSYIKFRNIIVSNCTADHGAAVYADKSTVEFENCIFHNNTTTTIGNSGVVYATNGSYLEFNHCDVLRNVGHASYLGNNDTKNYWQNSIFYGNMDRALADTNTDTVGLNSNALASFSGNTANAKGAYCMFDANSASFSGQFGGNDTGNQWQYNLQYKFADGTGQGYPRFVNPTKNSGVTKDGDATYYGRGVSFEPHNNNPIVNMASHADIHTSWGTDIIYVTRDFGGLPDIGAVENHEANQYEEGENAYADGQKPYGDAYYVRDYSANGSGLLAYATNEGSKGGTLSPVADGIYNAAGELLDGASWEYAVNGNGHYTLRGPEYVDANSIFIANGAEDPSRYTGKFRIKTGTNTYIYVDGANLKTTTEKSKAAIVTVSGSTTSAGVPIVNAGNRNITTVIGGQTYYFYRNGSSANVQTGTAQVNIASVSGGFSITANNRLYLVNAAGNVTTPSNSRTYTTWTFEPENALIYTETPVKQDGVTKLTEAEKKAGVAANAGVSEPLQFHVYKSIEDYNNSPTKKTYKIKRFGTGTAYYLKNNTGNNAAYLYPNTSGDNFILIQDGEYGKYYIYDVTTNKYVYYYTGTSITSRVRMDANTKSTWWIDKSSTTGALNIVYGEQPWTTTSNYAITCTTNTGTRVNLAAKTNADAQFVLIANQAYDVYNYKVEAKPAETLNGLQYAVNLANEKFSADHNHKEREVKVAKGIYTNVSPAAGDATVQQPYAYMIKEGVNVYGGFPENGNPGMNERQPKTFITILQPQTTSSTITMHYSVPSTANQGYSRYVVDSYGNNKISATAGNDAASVGRVLVQPNDFTVETIWDGFTIQNGYLNTTYMNNIGAALAHLTPADVKTAGGAGVLLQGKGILTNCVVQNNVILCSPSQYSSGNMTKTGPHTTTKVGDLYTMIMGGAGVFMSGTEQGTAIENCVVASNQILTKAFHRTGSGTSGVPDNIWMFGGGIYQCGGNVYNTIVHDNYAATIDPSTTTITGATGSAANNEMVLGSGVFVANGNFYNNTIVSNESASYFQCHNNHCSFAGVHVATDAKIYNTLIARNESHWSYEHWTSGTNPGNGVPVSAFKDDASDRWSRAPENVHIYYSFLDVKKGQHSSIYDSQTKTYRDLLDDLASQNDTENTNIYLDADQKQATGSGTAIDLATVYDSETYKLVTGSKCFNTGTENIPGVIIPDYDAEYTERIKDCAIDMGAYEFNGAAGISPDETSVTGQAIYYVTPDGYGARTAANPENAACAAKLQHVIDAAGRYKFQHPEKQVIVKVANGYDYLHPNNGTLHPGDDGYKEPANFTYYATRTTDWTDQDVRLWSIIIPRGVEVWGGYSDVTLITDSNGNLELDANGDVQPKLDSGSNRIWSNADNGFNTRNITMTPTYFDSYYENKLEKTDAFTYHVVTFTDRVYDTNGLAYLKDESDKVATGADSKYKDLGGTSEDDFLHMTITKVDKTTTIEKVKGNVITGNDGKPVQIDGSYASNRAVLDGIFVSGGQADAASGNYSTANINSYGGAALVNEHAYVRNCVLVDNYATNGGALALTDRALVSGCLIMENVAGNQGGGIYVFENGTKLSNGTTINTTAGTGQQMDNNMPHVFTSTIVANTAQQGGGIWFTSDINSNARFNSVAVWQNDAADQANVHGMVNPEQPTDDETLSEIFYPFSYSLIQDVRASGTNNLDAMSHNSEGVRFVNKNHDKGQNDYDPLDIAEEKNEATLEAKLADFGYYGLTTYSVLSSRGMPNEYYTQLKSALAISDVDLLGTQRIDTEEINSFIEIGARALPKRMPSKQLMLRLFVAHPDAVDTETATRFMRLREGEEPADKSSDAHKAWEATKYYSQMGSSFAYPFNFLQDAIDYITRARNGRIRGLKLSNGDDATSDIVRNLPFEIVLGSGTYYPTQSLSGSTESVWAHTFAIPEGVTIIGGFNPRGGGETYYGRYYKKGTISDEATGDIYTYVETIPEGKQSGPEGQEVGRGYNSANETVTLPEITDSDDGHANKSEKTITFQQWHIQDIADRRAMIDNNKNGIIEPWEFANQTIISGNAVNGETDGVYHIMTAVADADAVGNLPKVQSTYRQVTGIDFVGEGDTSLETGYQWHEQGQQIRLNGLIVTGGNALTYLSTALDDYGSYMFYHGAGLLVDGNRYKNTIDARDVAHTNPAFHNSAAYGVGYRDIPVSITNCQFRNNKAGYGGAISSNGSLTLFDSAFEQNMAIGQTETPADGDHWYTNITGSKKEVTEVAYPGQGGAIHVTNQLSAFNTLFANNEACLADGEEPTIELVQHPTFRVPVKDNASATLRAAGGAIMMGSAANHHIVNCDFVRNKANAYPAVFTMNPTTHQEPDSKGEVDTHDYSQIINTVAWGNEVNVISGNADYLRASKLMVNIGKKNRSQDYITTKTTDPEDFYSPAFTSGNVPKDAALASDNAESGEWQEAVWFCAYEDGVGFNPTNTLDLREVIQYSPKAYAPTMIATAANKVKTGAGYQNCNILIVAANGDVDGPNFGNPSVKAGFEGFTEGADWSPSRFNRLTDNGNGWIKQTVDAATLDVTFNNDDRDSDEHLFPRINFEGAYPITHYISELPGAGGVFPEYKLWLPLGREAYMRATNDLEARDQYINNTNIGKRHKNYPRISPDPTIGLTKAYIDIGVYEYQKQPLLKPGNEVDILWVSTKERPENGVADGSTWSKPTSDLQRAINTLLQSRNGHKKEIRIMEGEYAPVTPQTIEGVSGKVNAFVIDTKSLNASAIVPSAWSSDLKKDKYFAQSLTIKGGYSSEIMYEYDPVKYKTVIRQKEAADGSNDDHLIYVADPTVRYYYDSAAGYSSNNDGATWSTSSSAESHTARTMPIQIDGVTLVNSMAEAGIDGSAIYYPEQATTMTQAHSVSVDAELTYYTDASHETKSGHDGKDETDFPLIEGGKTMNDPAKIVITKTQVVGSGKPTTLTEHDEPATASAVYIGKYGGHALIYNTVFHSNFGMPLNAYNTVNVNNTFGLNAGKVQLNDVALATSPTPYVTSEMHNSALWKNNETSTKGQYGAQVYFGNAVAAGSAKFTYNSYTGATTDATNHLTSLDDLNSNIGEGPNFVDPENADIESRNFDIKPSMRLLNQGNNEAAAGLYYDKILHYDLGYTIEVDGQQVEQYANYDYALSATTDVDVMNRPRFKSVIDLGAYEFQGSLYDVLYVDPNKSHSNDATGKNWDSAFGYGDLQNAVDLAAIYHATTPSKEAYVFVKGNSSTNKELNTNETLIIRDGVTAYGSIISSYNEWHGDTKHAGNVSEYIKDMTSIREGVASEAASKTIVTGIKVDGNASYNGGTTGEFPALVDGFVVTNPNSISTPVVDVTSKSKDATIVVRNVVVADNNVTGGADVAKISNGLIYEALFRDNKTTGSGAVLRVANAAFNSEGQPIAKVTVAGDYATKGYAVNVTVEGKTVGADDSKPVDGNDGAAAENDAQIYNSITNSITVPAASASGAYGSIKNQHISGYFYNIADPNLNYQLTETSKYIDMCDQTVNPMTTAGATNLVQFINYDTDRDILGNPRTLAGVTDGKTVSTKTYLLDRGAFETWKVKNTKNAFFCGESGTISTIEPYKTNLGAKYSYIKKHFYPHDGSVCYIMEGQTLVIDPFDPAHEVKATPHNPGFMLVQKGANFYGNGRPATCAYLAIERDVKQGGSIVSIPYAMKYNENVSKPMYDSNGYLTQLDNNVVSAASEYNGLKRSDWKYIFQKTETNCWTPIGNTAVTAANRGVLLEAKSNNFSSEPPVVDKVTLRFTGQGTSMTDYIYTEEGVSKNVLLTKYDDVVSTNNGADYTDELDMGWNCFGLPYLVSSYKPYQKVSIGSETGDAEKNKVVKNESGEYSMYIPHTLWLYYDGTQAPDGTTSKPTMGDGGYYNVNSWESTTSAWHVSDAAQTSIWVGEGIFTQTATLDDTESLKFWLPVAPTMKADGAIANAKGSMMVRYYVDATGIVETEAPENVELIATEYYTPGGVRINKPQRGYVTLIRKIYSNGFVKIEKQFVR